MPVICVVLSFVSSVAWDLWFSLSGVRGIGVIVASVVVIRDTKEVILVGGDVEAEVVIGVEVVVGAEVVVGVEVVVAGTVDKTYVVFLSSSS